MGSLPAGTVNGFAVHPTSSNLMFVAMRQGVFRSEDGGGRWTAAAGGPKDAAAIGVHPTRRNEIYVATARGHLVISHDEGRTWTAWQHTR